MLTKKQMTEEDIKLQFITPAITATWDLSQITMETKITDGKINLKGNLVVREKPICFVPERQQTYCYCGSKGQ